MKKLAKDLFPGDRIVVNGNQDATILRIFKFKSSVQIETTAGKPFAVSPETVCQLSPEVVDEYSNAMPTIHKKRAGKWSVD
jgi:hypothetical protein